MLEEGALRCELPRPLGDLLDLAFLCRLEACVEPRLIILELLDLRDSAGRTEDLARVVLEQAEQVLLAFVVLVPDDEAVEELEQDLRVVLVPACKPAGLVLT